MIALYVCFIISEVELVNPSAFSIFVGVIVLSNNNSQTHTILEVDSQMLVEIEKWELLLSTRILIPSFEFLPLVSFYSFFV